jgi:hypothetical protein
MDDDQHGSLVSQGSNQDSDRALVDNTLQTRPAIAQLAEHLTVDICRYQMVPGSIPGGRIASF